MYEMVFGLGEVFWKTCFLFDGISEGGVIDLFSFLFKSYIS